MMLLTEYIDVQTQGRWQEVLKNNKFSQYFIAAFLGATPGCLGALVTAMIVTSGDQAFVLLSLKKTPYEVLSFLLKN